MKIKPRSFFLIIFCFASIIAALFWGYKAFFKSAYPIKYEEYVSSACSKYNVDESLVYAVIKTESKFNENAVSSAGALGLMQITPETFNWLQRCNKTKNLSSDKLFDPKTNIDYGTYFLSMLIDKYYNEKVLLSAYNAGMGNVDKWLKDKTYSDDKKTLKFIPYPETENYVKSVIHNKNIYHNLYFKKDNKY